MALQSCIEVVLPGSAIAHAKKHEADEVGFIEGLTPGGGYGSKIINDFDQYEDVQLVLEGETEDGSTVSYSYEVNRLFNVGSGEVSYWAYGDMPLASEWRPNEREVEGMLVAKPKDGSCAVSEKLNIELQNPEV
jgi:hypothetical protein